MKKVYFVNKTNHTVGGVYTILALDNLNESKRQHIKDTIEKSCGYFDGDDSIILDEIVTKLLNGESCSVGYDDEKQKTLIVKPSDERADYSFSIRVMDVY